MYTKTYEIGGSLNSKIIFAYFHKRKRIAFTSHDIYAYISCEVIIEIFVKNLVSAKLKPYVPKSIDR